MKKETVHPANFNGKRLLAALLLCVMLLTLLPTSALAAFKFIDTDSPAVNKYMNTVTIYKWTRHTDSTTLPKGGEHPVLLVWPNGGIYRWCVNGYLDFNHTVLGEEEHACFVSDYFPTDAEYPDPGSMAVEDDTFYTLGNVSNLSIAYVGTDSDNGDQPKYKIASTAYGRKEYLDGWDDDDDVVWRTEWNYSDDDDNQMDWTFVGTDGNCDYAEDVDDKYFRIICNTRGGDVCFCFDESGSMLSAYEFPGSWTKMGKVQVYTGEALTVSVINSDYTVTADNGVFNMDGGAILWEGVTLTVMPGAVLSIDGTFFNNGTIHNYGTVLIQDGSCVTRYMPKDTTTAGRIICDGGPVDVKASLRDEFANKTKMLESRKADETALTRECNEADIALSTAQNERTVILNNATHKAELNRRESALNDARSARQDQEEVISIIEGQLKSIEAALKELKADSPERSSLEAEKAAAEAELSKAQTVLSPLEIRVSEAQDHYDDYYEACGAKAKEEKCLEIETEKIEKEAELAKVTAEIAVLSKRIEQLKAAGAEEDVASSVVQGEGVLIMTTDARMEMGLGYQSLQIVDGGSLVCGGTLLCPDGIYVRDSKIHVMNSGNLFLQYQMQKNILNLDILELQRPHTLDAGFPGMGNYYYSNCSMALVGKCIVRVDGVLRYAKTPIRAYNDTSDTLGHPTSIYEGEGIWSIQGGPAVAQDIDGTIIEYWNSKQYSKYYTDGSVENRVENISTITKTDEKDFITTITKTFGESAVPDNIVETVTKDDVTYGEVKKNGSGVITEGWVWLKPGENDALEYAEPEDGDAEKWVYVPAAGAFLKDGTLGVTTGEETEEPTEDETPVVSPTPQPGDYTAYYWDERVTKTFTLTSASGRYQTVDGAGSYEYRLTLKEGEGYTCDTWEWTAETRTYTDHTETLGGGVGIYNAGLSKAILSASYTNGEFAGATYNCEPDYYEGGKNWEKGVLLWTVNAKTGLDEVYTCRALEQGTGELVVYCGTAENPYQSARKFAGTKNLPYPAKYVGGDITFSDPASKYPLPMREKLDDEGVEGGWTDRQTYAVPMTSGAPMEYTDESCLYEAVTKYENGAETIITRYYTEGVNWNYAANRKWESEDRPLVWTAIAANGEVTKCYAKPETTAEADKYTNEEKKYQSMRWELELAQRACDGERTFTNWTALNYSSMPDPTDFLVSSDLPNTKRYTEGNITKTCTFADGQQYRELERFGEANDPDAAFAYEVTDASGKAFRYKENNLSAPETIVPVADTEYVYTRSKSVGKEEITIFDRDKLTANSRVRILSNEDGSEVFFLLDAEKTEVTQAYYRNGKTTTISGTAVANLPGIYRFEVDGGTLYFGDTEKLTNVSETYSEANVSYYTCEGNAGVEHLFRYDGNSFTEAAQKAPEIWQFGTEDKLYCKTPNSQKNVGFGIFEYTAGDNSVTPYYFKEGKFVKADSAMASVGETEGFTVFALGSNSRIYYKKDSDTYLYSTDGTTVKTYNVGTETEVTPPTT